MGPKLGTWYFTCKSDPRWDKSGRGTVGLFYQPLEVEAWVKECEGKFGPVPDDLEFGCMKD